MTVSVVNVGRCSVAITGKRRQVEGEAAHWRPVGLAVVWSGNSGCWQASVAAGVASVGQCSVAIGRQAVPGRRRGSALAANRGCRGLVRVSGCWQAAVAGVHVPWLPL